MGRIRTEADFWAHVNKTKDCWMWIPGKTADHYGHVHWRGRTYMVHRLAWELVNGPLPPGRHCRRLLRRCKNTTCVRPDHHFLSDWKNPKGAAEEVRVQQPTPDTIEQRLIRIEALLTKLVPLDTPSPIC